MVTSWKDAAKGDLCLVYINEKIMFMPLLPLVRRKTVTSSLQGSPDSGYVRGDEELNTTANIFWDHWSLYLSLLGIQKLSPNMLDAWIIVEKLSKPETGEQLTRTNVNCCGNSVSSNLAIHDVESMVMKV